MSTTTTTAVLINNIAESTNSTASPLLGTIGKKTF
jgi:hypothetical protein